MISSARAPRIVADRSDPRFALFVTIFNPADANNYNLIPRQKQTLRRAPAEYPIKRINDDLNCAICESIGAPCLNIFHLPGFSDVPSSPVSLDIGY